MTHPQMPQMHAQPYIPQQQSQLQWQPLHYMPQLPMQPLQPSVVYQLAAERHIVFYSIPSIPTEINMFCACLD